MGVGNYFGYSSKNILERPRKALREHWFAYLLVVPTTLFMATLIWFQFFYGVWLSFHETTMISPEPTWVGLANYELLLSWEAVRQSTWVSAVYSISLTIIHISLGLGAALVIDRIRKFEGVFNGIYLIGYTIAPVVIGTLWVYLLQPRLGPIFTFLTSWGILQDPIFWSTNPDSALIGIILVGGWTFWPFAFIVFHANLQTIPEQHYEAAKIYGASRIQTFLKVTLPQLKSAFLMVIAIRVIWNVSKIGQPLQMTNGEPGYSTSVLGILLYNLARSQGRLGRGYAVGVVMFVLTLAFVFVFVREYRRSTTEDTQ